MWCVAYTAVVPHQARERRRAELHDHLWESARVGLAPRAVASATLRGASSDLAWACGECARATRRGLGSPTLYVAASIVVIVQAAFVWSAVAPSLASDARGVSMLAACLLLAVAGVIVWRRGSGP